MIWVLKHSVEVKPLLKNPFVVNYSFTKSDLIVAATCVSLPLTWHSAGYANSLFFIPEIGTIKGYRHKINFGAQKVNFEPLQFGYKIEFYANKWIKDITLKFWEFE